ncbi:MAG TPA: DUF5681 domain-containing protein [Pyrinomonadaceae bacterium]|nr:DUF5681 domain-containing protein [Pyrinomonadaceae bacterium]
MQIPPKKYEVGRGRPPQQTRWQKGQTGNPNRIRKRIATPIVEMIDEFFAREIEIVENGFSRRVTNFEAILLQLWTKAMAGNRRAVNVFLKYKEFAATRGELGGAEVIFKNEIPKCNSEGGSKNG